MKIKDIKEAIKNLDNNLEVFIRCTYNPCGNIIEAGKFNKSTYGFFGKSIDCIIIEPIGDEDDPS